MLFDLPSQIFTLEICLFSASKKEPQGYYSSYRPPPRPASVGRYNQPSTYSQSTSNYPTPGAGVTPQREVIAPNHHGLPGLQFGQNGSALSYKTMSDTVNGYSPASDNQSLLSEHIPPHNTLRDYPFKTEPNEVHCSPLRRLSPSAPPPSSFCLSHLNMPPLSITLLHTPDDRSTPHFVSFVCSTFLFFPLLLSLLSPTHPLYATTPLPGLSCCPTQCLI